MQVKSETVDVDELIAAVKRAVALAGLSVESRTRSLRIVSVGLTLQAVLEDTHGGGVGFRLPIIGFEGKAGSQVTSRTTHTISLALEPLDTGRLGVRAGEDVEATIVDAVRTIQRTIRFAQGGSDPWALRSGTIDIQFGVTGEGTISLGINNSRSQEHTNTLSLQIEPVG